VSRRAAAPAPIVALGVGGLLLAFGAGHPLVLAALAAGAVLLLAAAPAAPRRLYLLAGAVSAAGLVLLNPFVAGEGELILFDGPRLPPFDGEVTVEELASGASAGLRVFAVVALVGALVAHVDADRLQAGVARVAPRSALVCALAVRLLPALERDAQGMVEAARLRGAALGSGSWLGRARATAPLAVPLLGTSMERGLDLAEAMTARGYGAGARTRTPAPSSARRDRALWPAAAAMLGVGLAAAVLGVADYRFYPTLDDPLAWPALAAACLALLVLAAAAAVRR